jgi:hypothetical protein
MVYSIQYEIRPGVPLTLYRKDFNFVLQKNSHVTKRALARLHWQFKLSVYGAYPQNLHGYRSTMLSLRPTPLHVDGQSHRTAIARTPALQENAIHRGSTSRGRKPHPVVSAYHSP